MRQLSRSIVGYGAIACAVPYLVLKVIWLTGGQLGVADAGMMRDTSMVALNVATAAMDLVGIAMALAFTHAWGQRIPAWLLLPPIWIAMGLLVRFVLLVPIAMAAGLLTWRSTGAVRGGPVQPWVYTLVYTEFVGLGVGLTIAFVLYARARWPWALQSTMAAQTHAHIHADIAADANTASSAALDPSASATHGVQAPLAIATALIAAAAGSLHVAWACGATIGLPDAIVARRSTGSVLLDGVDGVFAFAAAVGLLMLVFRIGPSRQTRTIGVDAASSASIALPLTLAWIGSGYLFAWGLWSLINALGNTALVRGRAIATPPIVGLLDLAQLLAGLLIGVIVLFLLAERRARWMRTP